MTKVTIYTRQLCSYCSSALDLLRRRGVEIDERDATYDAELRSEMVSRSGLSTFPQIFVGDSHIGGCDDLYELDRSGGLDDILGLER